MLNLNRQEDLLTQGQPPADRVLANPNPASPESGRPGSAPAGAAQNTSRTGSPSAAAPDAQLIAGRVYDMMRKDLLILHERSR